ncbi:flagellar hook-associated 2 domain protein [Pseudarthrobacter chlorophenolicus A6]|uniref:Flagellar hook-associated protein 2 n=1 Tax=Pseudarthrobacter chlorophenolicus (strain ATCC 700700 / DSM 12829 / CIP 107037 / JCM 12360 / KCTC 9906 / NCIMB 13794 / A6) TaxID=452863 RepID=B8HEL3_PSECP|nr:flagellar filament capping protein FliD [Pseudarthrobacter chlorophenolicus]ACL40958.1 flagellar hook-associated 2 domain protein [Pseudarthrobacter chlorophenolicus A6]SDQ72230.1 flagellar hook-associated protein 2 [Pseudarthrobacter chlorophenolicus]
MGLAIDGLSSGLDTTTLINSLMTLEAAPQNLIKTRAAAVQNRISALQGLNSAVADLATKAAKLAEPKGLELYTATSSSPKVTIAVGAGAKPGTVDFTVSQLAQMQVSVTKNLSAWPDTTLTITGQDGKATSVTPSSTSLDDVVSAVNASGAGVTASKISVGGGEYRLQFASAKTGAAGGFTVSGLGGPADLTTVQTAQDAQIKLWTGTSAEATLSSPTNTFADLLQGVSATVSEVSATPTRVTVVRDNAQISRAATDLVSTANGVLAQISTKTAVVTSTDAAGNPITSAGIFTGDSAIRTVSTAVLAAASAPIGGRSPSEFGISVTKTGTVEFDATKFSEALAKDPAGTMAAVSTIAGRVASAAKQASDPVNGLISTKIKGQQSTAKDYAAQIESWDDRLQTRRETLQRTYSALEVALSGMKAQSAWLSSQLAGLSTSSGSTSS